MLAHAHLPRRQCQVTRVDSAQIVQSSHVRRLSLSLWLVMAILTGFRPHVHVLLVRAWVLEPQSPQSCDLLSLVPQLQRGYLRLHDRCRRARRALLGLLLADSWRRGSVLGYRWVVREGMRSRLVSA